MSIDWSKPIEAFHEDGRVQALSVDFEENREFYTKPDLDHLPAVWLENGRSWASSIRADGLLAGWRVRNVGLTPSHD